MYTKKRLIEILEKNLVSEMKIIEFYLENAEKLNYAKNRKKIDKLVFESFDHAADITRELLELKKSAGKVDKKTLELALSEEKALQEIYTYEMRKTKDKKAKELLKSLIKSEILHEKILNTLK